jgi:hypothetical protein
MELSEPTLRKMFVELRAVGPAWPYDRGSEEDIATHLRDVVAFLQRSPRLVVEAQRDHYGSGYASYVHLFCHKRERKPASRPADSEIPGLDLYLCRLAPLAVYGAGAQTHYGQGAMSYSQLSVAVVGQSPPGDWTWEINELRTKLSRRGFEFPAPAALAAQLPFELKAKRYRPSFSPRCVFDAVYFWDE